MSARSTVLFAGRISDTNLDVLYTCPPAVTVLVKSLQYVSNAATAGSFNVMLTRSGVNVSIIQTASLAVNTSQQWTGWVALQPGDQLRVQATVQPFVIWVSGTHLDGVAPN